MNSTDEMIKKAETVKSAAELITLAKENNISLTADEAAVYFAKFYKNGELADEELDNVSARDICDRIIHYKYNIGQKVEFILKEDSSNHTGIILDYVEPGVAELGYKIKDSVLAIDWRYVGESQVIRVADEISMKNIGGIL